MNTNADITILNKIYDSENRQDVFLPTVIKGVSLYMKSGSTGDNKFRERTSTYKIRIPIDADMGGSSYADPVAYRGMSREEAATHWTLQEESVIVRGILTDEEMEGEIVLTELSKKYGSYITVTDFSDNTTRGIQRMKHWRIGGE